VPDGPVVSLAFAVGLEAVALADVVEAGVAKAVDVDN